MGWPTRATLTRSESAIRSGRPVSTTSSTDAGDGASCARTGKHGSSTRNDVSAVERKTSARMVRNADPLSNHYHANPIALTTTRHLVGASLGSRSSDDTQAGCRDAHD